MRLSSVATTAAFVAGISGLLPATAQAQYYSPLCNPFPLTWPFCVAGAVVYGVGAIVTAPFRAVAAPAYYYYPYSYGPQPYMPPPYYPPSSYPAAPAPAAPASTSSTK